MISDNLIARPKRVFLRLFVFFSVKDCQDSYFSLFKVHSSFQRRLLNFIEKALVEDVIPILMAAFHYQLDQLLSHCIEKLVKSDLDSGCIDKELPDEISSKIKLLRRKSLQEAESGAEEVDPLLEKRLGRIHKALDSDDVKLVELLLSESNLTLDDAHALHYAIAYCDPKIVMEVLSLGSADLNLRNSRGYSVLHVAARRKEPSILMALLTRGANASETASDGQNAVSICRRLTRPKDYNEKTKQGQESNKDRICIDVLEREMRRTSLSENVSILSPSVADDLNMKLDYLENRGDQILFKLSIFLPPMLKISYIHSATPQIWVISTNHHVSSKYSGKKFCSSMFKWPLFSSWL